MPAFIRGPRDFWSGAIFVSAGLAAMLIGDDYPMGSAGTMGPGYFPTVLGGLLAILGAVSMARAVFVQSEPIERFAIKPTVLILGSALLFGVLVRNAGIAFAVVMLVLGSGLASSKFHLGRYALLAIGMAAFATLVFVKALGVPLPVFGSWFFG